MIDLHPISGIETADLPHPEAERDYGGNEPADEPPPADPDKEQPSDPPARPGVSFGENEAAEETPQAEGDKEQPWDPPPLEAAEKNGR